MRIALVADGVYPYDRGGHQIRVHNLVKRYTKDHDVDLYVQQKPDVDYPNTHEDAQIVEIDSRIESPRLRLTVGGIFYARAAARKIRNRNYDVVDVLFCCQTSQFETPTVATYGSFLQRWREISGLRERVVNSIPTGIQYYLNRQTLAGADHAVALSDLSQNELQSIFSPSIPTTVIKNGIDETHFSTDGPTATFPDIGEFVGVFIGRLHDEKGVFELLEATARVETDFGLLYVGSGPAREELEARARELGLTDRVMFEGFVDYKSIPNYYRAADVCLLPSYFEIQPLTCLEAMACGTPVIASDIAGVREIVDDENNGLLVPASAVMPLIRAIDRLCSSQKSYKDIIKNGSEFAETRTWEKIVKETLQVYQNLQK